MSCNIPRQRSSSTKFFISVLAFQFSIFNFSFSVQFSVFNFHFSKRDCKGTKKNAHLQTFPQKNSTVVHFLSRIVACGLARICGYATKKGNRFSDIFLRKSNRLNARHCYTVASEGTHPQGRGVPKYKKCTQKSSRVSQRSCFAQIFAMNYFQIMRYLRYRRMSSRVIFFWVNNFCFLRSTIIDHYQQFFRSCNRDYCGSHCEYREQPN